MPIVINEYELMMTVEQTFKGFFRVGKWKSSGEIHLIVLWFARDGNGGDEWYDTITVVVSLPDDE